MEPTHKSYKLNKAINEIFGIDREKSIRGNTCVFCSKVINPDTDFRDELSRKEFTISSICQECQDKTFGV